MTHWKPDKPGIYRLDGRDCGVVQEFGGDFDESADSRTKWKSLRLTMPDGPWSLMGPDWQPGAPSAAQLGKWKWWAVTSMDSGTVVQLVCGDCSLRHGVLVVGMSAMDPSVVFESAPIQKDMSNGPLWVPMEVTDGE